MPAAATASDRLRTFYQDRPVSVTGGAGFIGSHISQALVERGARVVVIDDFSQGRIENLEPIRGRIRLVRGSILDPVALRAACDGAEVIFHEAALCSVPRSVEQPVEYHQVNTTGTLRVLEAARAAGTRRVVFAASSSAYGDSPALPKIETMPPEPMSPYAASKCGAEFLVRAYAHCYGLSTISLRYFNIFGPRQRADSPYAAVVPRFAEAMAAGRKPVIFGDGTQTRDFTHVANAVHANLLAGSSEKPLLGEVVNIACGRSFDLRHLVGAMAKLLGASADCEFAPPRVGEVMHSSADISAARALIGYEPVMSFEDGLRDTLAPFLHATMTKR
jgi:UDP-glucose 4-epimerase